VKTALPVVLMAPAESHLFPPGCATERAWVRMLQRELTSLNLRLAVVFGMTTPPGWFGVRKRSDSRQASSLSASSTGRGSTEPHASRTCVAESATYRESSCSRWEASLPLRAAFPRYTPSASDPIVYSFRRFD
jgi:hypothetical protein